MALNRVLNEDQLHGAAPQKSALQTFATIMNLGTSLGSLAGAASASFNPQTPDPKLAGKYTLGTNLNFAAQPSLSNPDWNASLAGGQFNPSAQKAGWENIYQQPTYAGVNQMNNGEGLTPIKSFQFRTVK